VRRKRKTLGRNERGCVGEAGKRPAWWRGWKENKGKGSAEDVKASEKCLGHVSQLQKAMTPDELPVTLCTAIDHRSRSRPSGVLAFLCRIHVLTIWRYTSLIPQIGAF
jgi:hypothetical protein